MRPFVVARFDKGTLHLVVDRNFLYYGEIADRYDAIVTSAGYDLGERVCDWIGEVRPTRKLEILDLGIGTGLSSEKLSGEGNFVTGVDASQAMLDQCRKKGFCRALYRADLSTGTLPVFPRRFDGVICFGLIEFIRDPRTFFRAISQVIKPNGVFVLAVRDIALNPLFTETTWHGLNVDKRAKDDVGLIVIHHSWQLIATALNETGFRIHREFEVFAYQSPTQGIDTNNRVAICVREG